MAVPNIAQRKVSGWCGMIQPIEPSLPPEPDVR